MRRLWCIFAGHDWAKVSHRRAWCRRCKAKARHIREGRYYGIRIRINTLVVEEDGSWRQS